METYNLIKKKSMFQEIPISKTWCYLLPNLIQTNEVDS